LKPKG
jgi:hypothetical protein